MPKKIPTPSPPQQNNNNTATTTATTATAAACLEAGYADFDQIVADPDLELLRQDPRFAQVVQRFQPKAGGFLGFKLPW